jgi:hypothetical protein
VSVGLVEEREREGEREKEFETCVRVDEQEVRGRGGLGNH